MRVWQITMRRAHSSMNEKMGRKGGSGLTPIEIRSADRFRKDGCRLQNTSSGHAESTNGGVIPRPLLSRRWLYSYAPSRRPCAQASREKVPDLFPDSAGF